MPKLRAEASSSSADALHKKDLQARSCESLISSVRASSCLKGYPEVVDIVQAY